ncbi:tRNA-dihydrouridine(20a/20b) synthase [NAD(P)+]-like protein [Borealophlyctis nickersoniae]|nr:tRNA-dihydrouridine(20a/20b) synthase [NAD(P)+]-like protein [Borealophlyctis nickersoniae]
MEADTRLDDLDYTRSDVDGDATPFDGGAEQEDGMWKEGPRLNPLELLKDRKYLRICAPMVRYSKLPFRELVRGYDVDVAFTPMILSDVFKHSIISRKTEFRSNARDDPVVVQFAASSATDLADAAELAAPYANGVDLNCGCPQKWAIHEKIGSYLMEQPELVRDMIRVHPDLNKTVEYVRRAQSVGVDWITVHGRTRKMKSSEPVNLEAIKLVKEHGTVPIFANGDIFSLADAERTVEYTGVDGVMSARGLLENPALFSGYDSTPLECVKKYVKLGVGYGSSSFIFHHHLMFMLESSMSRAEKKHFNCLTSIPAIVDYLENHYGLDFREN